MASSHTPSVAMTLVSRPGASGYPQSLPTAPDGGAAGGAMLVSGLLADGLLDGTAPVRAAEQPVGE
jgi:hypothetical protein